MKRRAAWSSGDSGSGSGDEAGERRVRMRRSDLGRLLCLAAGDGHSDEVA
eukprot:CAMPEP_0202070382 /NCGR_PEP_ID=MMETSP0964-20121228/1126_1 /ASSEMBLY_ACC=CAM_ASM_000500 /TAXON_ID=4773 /ORGANISM="Schizochytrium aggregatum, Strain ATCC28209" /LENGTH=49 /DNA_ID= /DNA_START= /DNA_END= /DNA_ORIENTATION=